MSVLIRQRDPQPNEFLMGLESHGYVMFPGCDTEFDIPILNNKYNLGRLAQYLDLKHRKVKSSLTVIASNFDMM